MVKFERYTLPNQLRVILHHDATVPMVVLNILYDVGAKDENPEQTGFAHLFEHLMFGGSINIPSYDEPLQKAGAENNAFTSNDITNYYIQIPKQNLETALWLESDRMLSLAFSDKSLETQRSVVIEEFKQRYLNQPYGDVWMKLRALSFQKHPYQWPTIGKEISHIENAKMEQVKAFYQKHYNPSNAILVMAGDFETVEAKHLIEKWFADIPSGEKYIRNLPVEPVQKEARVETVAADVPNSALYMTYHMGARLDQDYYVADLISDVLSRGESSRLHQRLVKENPYFSEINAYITGDMEPGLFVIEGKPNPHISLEEGKELIEECLNELKTTLIPEHEMAKILNKMEATSIFSEMNLLNKAMGLAYFELLGDADLINTEVGRYRKISSEDLRSYAVKLFKNENCNTLYYRAKGELDHAE